MSLYQYTKINNKYIKDCDKNIESSSSLILGWVMLQKLPVNNLEWIENNSHF